MNKKFWVILLTLMTALCLCLGLSACGGNDNPGETTNPGEQGGTSETDPGEQGGETENDPGEQGGETNPPTHVHSYTVENECSVCGAKWEFTDGLTYELDESTDTYTVTGIGTALDGVETLALVIPYGHQGKSVTAIGEWAFYFYGDIYGYSGLTSVAIPSSVTSIGGGAFGGCEGLTGVYISDLSAWCKIDFGNYGANPLCYAHHLYLDNIEVTTLNIPEDIVEIKDYAFSDCDGLTSVIIPDSVTSIGDSVFDRVRDTTAKSKILSKQPLSRA